jgi:hypothetical protein
MALGMFCLGKAVPAARPVVDAAGQPAVSPEA